MIHRTHARPPRVLLVEDNPADVRLLREGLLSAGATIDIEIAGDGEEALDYLRSTQQGDGEARGPRPDLILLDLNLPRKDGREVLVEIKTDDDLKTIPVLVLSTSSAERDIELAYEAHANAYLTKPTSFEDLKHLVGAVEQFWLSTARLPT